MSTTNFYQWRRKFNRPLSHKQDAGGFIAVELRSTSQAVRLSLPGGATLELPEELNPAHLRELIAAVVDVTWRAAGRAEDV
ncbi:MAG: IS66 family insertion sequence element accessory protein TnpA [Aureliella sp.]